MPLSKRLEKNSRKKSGSSGSKSGSAEAQKRQNVAVVLLACLDTHPRVPVNRRLVWQTLTAIPVDKNVTWDFVRDEFDDFLKCVKWHHEETAKFKPDNCSGNWLELLVFPLYAHGILGHCYQTRAQMLEHDL